MIQRAVILAALLPAVALAQWPSWLSPNVGAHDRGNEALSGAVERLTVAVGTQAWTSYMTTNLYASYFSQATKLRIAKSMLSNSVATGVWVQRDDSALGTNEPSSWPMVVLNHSNVLAFAGASSNFWANNPSVAVATHPDGYVSYPSVASSIVWITQARTVRQLAISNSLDVLAWVYNTNSFAAAYAEATTNMSVIGTTVLFRSFAYSAIPVAGTYQIVLERLPNYCALTNNSTAASVAFIGEVYAQVEKGTFDAYSPQNDNVTTNLRRYIVWTNSQGVLKSPYWTFYEWPETNPPTQYSTNDSFYLGWQIPSSGYNIREIRKYSAPEFTNGFKWFR